MGDLLCLFILFSDFFMFCKLESDLELKDAFLILWQWTGPAQAIYQHPCQCNYYYQIKSCAGNHQRCTLIIKITEFGDLTFLISKSIYIKFYFTLEALNHAWNFLEFCFKSNRVYFNPYMGFFIKCFELPLSIPHSSLQCIFIPCNPVGVWEKRYHGYLDVRGSQRVFLKTEDWPYLGDF